MCFRAVWNASYTKRACSHGSCSQGELSSMGLSFRTFIPGEMEALIDFIVADSYPCNANPHPTREQVASWIDSGLYSETFWIVDDGYGLVGAMHYHDASAITAEVHIRIHTPYRGRGIGSQAIEWLTTYLFNRFPEKHRV